MLAVLQLVVGGSVSVETFFRLFTAAAAGATG